jgi:hypothetical protein
MYMPYKNTRRGKIQSLKVPTLTLYYLRAIHNHQKKKRTEPQGAYADALLRTRLRRPPEEVRSQASRYLR